MRDCLICQDNNLTRFYSIEKMPIYMGTIDSIPEKYQFMPMNYVECQNCGNVQLEDCPSLDDVYMKNHNIDLVGKLWDEHFNELKSFIGDVKDKVILEISDPSAKLAKRFDDFNKWVILEPNPHFQKTDKLDYIKGFLNSEFQIDFEIDLIVHSHFFEHSLDPNSDLKKMYELLPPNGEMFFSIPDLESLIKDSNSPTALNFEHTYFYDLDSISNLLKNNGFEVKKYMKFKNHSIFFHVSKQVDLKKNPFIYNSRKDIFISSLNYHSDMIEKINEFAKNFKNVFIYGAHVTSQFYLFNGLNIDLIGILDKSTSKNQQYLYGTSLKSSLVENFKNYEKCCIIVSHSSVYKNEIVNNLENIKENTEVFYI